MKQQQFVEKHSPLWEQFEELIHQLESRNKNQGAPQEPSQLPSLYRKICNHYALAINRRYSPTLVSHLKELVWRGHHQLYRTGGSKIWQFIHFIAWEFPRALRRSWRYLLASIGLFVIPGLIMGYVCMINPNMVYSVLGEEDVASMETMYDPENKKIGREEGRDADSDFVMFGFYIYNNISIGFRTFAGGILIGLGTVFLLLFNGIVIGGVAGHLTRMGYEDTFWPFVIGHGSFELTAIVICGAAGLMLAHGLLAPERFTRLYALKIKALEALPLVIGAALMLVVAAMIEAFWSSNGFAKEIKYGIGAVLWLIVLSYLTLAGRRFGSE